MNRSALIILGALLVLFVAAQKSATDFAKTFPSDFIFGTATSAYQIEGAYNEDGRGMSIWDTFAHTPNKIRNNETGDIADDHYHKVEQDVLLMKNLGIKHYRMSISWSRILPNGTISNINQKGIDYYNNEINLLIKHGIQVYVTLYHWDLPQALHDSFGGWLDKVQIANAFADYADLCFKTFGDRVKYWITLNEPWVISVLGYGSGVNAPGRCSSCVPEGGDSSIEPYTVSHSLILAHARAVQVYRSKYQQKQGGKIGITFNSDFFMPQTEADVNAAERLQLFLLGWYADPIFKTGDYPQVMRDMVGGRLPTFTEEEKQLVKNSADFFGINHYTSRYVTEWKGAAPKDVNWWTDSRTNATIFNKDNEPIGPRSESDWLYVYPKGIRGLCNWIKTRYNNPLLFITENGVDAPNECCMPREQALNDTFRVNYISSYLEELAKAAVEDNVNVRAYMLWSLMDNFEWANGYTSRFGMHYVDYKDKALTRYQKESSKWYGAFVQEQEKRWNGNGNHWIAWLTMTLALLLIGFLVVIFAATVARKLFQRRAYQDYEEHS